MYTSLVRKQYPDLSSSFNKGHCLPQILKVLHLQTINSEAHGQSLLKIIINFEPNLSELSFAFNLPQPQG